MSLCRKTFRRSLFFLLACILSLSCSFAEEIDLSAYTMEELREIQERISQKIQELELQDALEHGDRQIVFEAEELLLYVSQRQKLDATVVRRIESAPSATSLLWESSDPAIAQVNNGWVTPLAPGETLITAKAADNERIQASIQARVVNSVQALTVEPARAELVLGAGDSLRATVLLAQISPADAFHQDLVWTSSDERIATVDADGMVYALTPGRVVITVQTQDPSLRQQKKATCTVTVQQAVTGISLPEEDVQLGVRKTLRLSPTLAPENATNTNLKWESSRPEIASVSPYGLVTGNQPGECVITCSAADGYGATASCVITVAQQITKITDSSGKNRGLGLRVGGEATLTARIEPEDASNQQLQWISSDASIVKVMKSEGSSVTLRGMAKGSATVTGEATDGSGKSIEYTITVEDAFSVDATGKADSGVSYGYKWFTMEIANHSISRTVDGVTIRYSAEDVYGEKIKSYGLGDYEVEATFNLTLVPGATKTTPQEIIYGFNQAKVIHAAVVKLHYKDGETVVAEEPEELRIEMKEQE